MTYTLLHFALAFTLESNSESNRKYFVAVVVVAAIVVFFYTKLELMRFFLYDGARFFVDID